MLPKIELKTKGIHTEVIIDGHRLKKVRNVSFVHEAGKSPVLSVDFVAADLYMDGEFVPALPEVFRPYYEHKQVHSSRILVSPVYQRTFNPRKVDAIVAEFNPNLVNPPKLSFWDGKYYVFDGQHTIAALKRKNNGRHLNIQCKVFYGLTELDETELFIQQNGKSSPVKTNEKLKALYNIGDPDVTGMVKACESIGLTIDFDAKNRAAYRIQAVKTLFDSYKELGPDGLIYILTIIKEAWAGIPDSLSREMISGMTLFYTTYRNEFQRKRLVGKLKKTDPVVLIREAKSITSRSAVGCARVILRTYNLNATPKTYVEGRI